MARAKPTEATEKAPKATKSPKTPKATKAPKTEKVDGEKATRTPGGERGWLATSIDRVLRREGASMTVSDIAAQVVNVHGDHPSSGAVAAALNRWAEQGYIEVTKDRPMAFKKFTKKYQSKSLADFLEDQRTARKSERAAAKAEKTPA